MKKWKHFAVTTLALLAVTFWGMPQAVAASTGVNVATHTQSEIKNYISQQGARESDTVTFVTQPSYSNPYVLGRVSTETQNSGLAMVNQIRYIAGLSEVTLDTQYRDEMQAAALVNAANNSLSHQPSRPAGMGDDLYNLGKTGAGMANLSLGRETLNASILDGWMGDYTSPSNLDTLGHRRWVLNPTMGKTCFGIAGYCYSMYAHDRSHASSVTGVVWPAQQMPVEYFDTKHPWSYSLGDTVDGSKVKVTLKKRGTSETWNFSSAASDGHFAVNNGWYGQPGCIIFRPENYSFREGDIFDVTITGLATNVSYSVEFFTLGGIGKPDPVVLTNGAGRIATLKTGGELEYAFTAPSAGTYSFFTKSNPQIDTIGYLYDSIAMKDSNLIDKNDDKVAGQDINFEINATLAANQKVYLKIVGWGDAAGSIQVWACRNNKLSFQKNGGTAVPSDTTILQNYIVTLPGMSNSKTCKLTLDANGGTVASTSKTYTLTQNGWNTNASGTGTEYAAGTKLTMDKDYTLYVQWEKKPVGELPVPTKAGYTFDGWYTAASGGTKVTAETTISQDKTVYAHWSSSFQITKNPSSKTVVEGSGVKFTVTATGTNLTYQWQYSKDGGTTWTNNTVSSANKATLSLTAKTSLNGRKYRCIVTSGSEQLISKTVSLTVKSATPVAPAISAQPANVSAAEGTAVKFTVTATGDDLIYQWQYSKDGGKTWTNSTASGAKTATMSTTAKESFNGRLYRCTITNDVGSVTTTSAKLTVKAAKPVITGQPAAATAKDGENVKFSVTATGTGLTYQWQYSKDGGVTWVNNTVSSATSATLSLTAKDSWSGRLYHCIVTNSAGSVTTEAASLTVKTVAPVISTQPVTVTTTEGAPVTFSITATGTGLTYQWQYSKDGGKTWTNSTATGAKTATMSTTAKESYNGRQYRCIVTNAGGQVTSNPAKLTIIYPTVEKPVIRSYCSRVEAQADCKVPIDIIAEGAKTYRWQYSNDGGETWIDSTLSSAKTSTLTVTLKASYNGRLYRCVVANEGGEVISKSTEIVIIN